MKRWAKGPKTNHRIEMKKLVVHNLSDFIKPKGDKSCLEQCGPTKILPQILILILLPSL